MEYQSNLFNEESKLPMAKEDDPQYKALTLGLSALSTSELIYLTIQGCGFKALDNVRKMLHKAHNNINNLSKLSFHELTKIEGIGKVKALSLVAAIELGRRKQIEQHLERRVISTSFDAAEIFKVMLSDSQVEKFAVMYLNRGNKVLATEIISSGGITGTIADPRIILKRALEVGAVSLVLSHNHPSGSLKPSRADEELTKKIKEAARYFDMSVLDHVIVSQEGYYSFADEGVL